MGVIFDEPKYPVIDKAPGFWKTVSNFSLGDIAIFGGTAAICGPLGYYVDLHRHPCRHSRTLHVGRVDIGSHSRIYDGIPEFFWTIDGPKPQ